jgi:hypothetical protein
MKKSAVVFSLIGILANDGTAFASTLQLNIAPAVPIPAPLLLLGVGVGIVAIVKKKFLK